MPGMADPHEALVSFQKQVRRGLELTPGTLDPGILVHMDQPNGQARFTYARIVDNVAIALAMFVLSEPIDGVPCFGLGYAVPKKYRRRGNATAIARDGLAELQHGLARGGISSFYIEAVVGIDNLPSQRVSEKVVSAIHTKITDSVSGFPALRYVRKLERES